MPLTSWCCHTCKDARCILIHNHILLWNFSAFWGCCYHLAHCQKKRAEGARRICCVLTTVYIVYTSAHLRHLISTWTTVQYLNSHKQHSSLAIKVKDVFSAVCLKPDVSLQPKCFKDWFVMRVYMINISLIQSNCTITCTRAFSLYILSLTWITRVYYDLTVFLGSIWSKQHNIKYIYKTILYKGHSFLKISCTLHDCGKLLF